MFTTMDKAIAALVLAVLSIINIIWDVQIFGEKPEEIIGIIISVLMPILVYLIPNKRA